MALNFPTNPSNGDTYLEASTTWQYDGVAWNVIPTTSSTFPNTYGTVVVNGTSLASTTSGDDLRINSGAGIIINSSTETNTLTISTGAGGSQSVGFSIAADDSTQRALSNGETIQFIGGTGITTSSDTEGNITIASTVAAGTFSSLTEASAASITIDKIYEPAIAMLRLDNVGTSAYTIPSHYSGNNPAIYAISGTTIAFDLDQIAGHPFEIQDNTLTALTSNLVHVSSAGVVSVNSAAQGKSSGTLYWRIPEGSPGTYVYQCQSHASMFGSITVKDLSNI